LRAYEYALVLPFDATPLTLADIADKNVYMCAQEWCGSNVVRRVQTPAADRV
jgi:hypothetical protein